jgi:hypothetical protein
MLMLLLCKKRLLGSLGEGKGIDSKMAAVTVVDLFCDGEACSNWFGNGSTTVSLARHSARREGWVTKRGGDGGKLKDFCPSCAANPTARKPMLPEEVTAHKSSLQNQVPINLMERGAISRLVTQLLESNERGSSDEKQ